MGLIFACSASHAQFAPGAPGARGNNGPSISLNSIHDNSNQTPTVHNRVIQGSVRDADGKVEPNAVVYLKNKATSNIQSTFPDAAGQYRVGNLVKGADYEVWAVANQKKGSARTVSQYDTRDQLIFNLTTP